MCLVRSCAGMCLQVAPVTFKKEENPSEGVHSGVLECPEATVTQWFTFHYACTKSGNIIKPSRTIHCHSQYNFHSPCCKCSNRSDCVCLILKAYIITVFIPVIGCAEDMPIQTEGRVDQA